jgi:predicted HTH domain antitoxin
MNISIQLPDDVARQMERRWHDLPRHALEALAVDAYRSGVVTSAQVQALLGLSSRFEVDSLLKKHGAYFDYTEDDLEQDLRTLRGLADA